MQPSLKSKASLAKSPSQKSEFSLYGLTQHNQWGQTDAFTSVGRKTHYTSPNPEQATNKYYDKHIVQALDKYTSQEIHIAKLKEFQRDIHKIKNPFGT
jgi:hypothetical protein